MQHTIFVNSSFTNHRVLLILLFVNTNFSLLTDTVTSNYSVDSTDKPIRRGKR